MCTINMLQCGVDEFTNIVGKGCWGKIGKVLINATTHVCTEFCLTKD